MRASGFVRTAFPSATEDAATPLAVKGAEAFADARAAGPVYDFAGGFVYGAVNVFSFSCWVMRIRRVPKTKLSTSLKLWAMA